MQLDETEFYEKRMINKRKKLILEGKDPDEIEEILERKKDGKPKKKQKVRQIKYNTVSVEYN